jgi:porin
MPNADSPKAPARSSSPHATRRLAAATCLIFLGAPASVRAANVSPVQQIAGAPAPTAPAGVARTDVAAPPVPVVRTGISSTAPTSTPLSTPRSAAARAEPIQRASIDWRSIVSHPGVTLSAEEITDASAGSAAFAGARSLRTHSNLELTLDMDSLVGWRGLTLYAQHKSKTGRNGSGEAAFVQNFSNIDADDFRAMGEVWVEQRLLQDRVAIKAGRIDFNSAFAGTDNGASFLNASMGFSPSIVAAPTFPLPTLGVEATVSPWANFDVGVGVFNGLDGAPAPVGGASRFQIAQANQQWTLGGSQLAGRLGAGAWRHTGLFSAMGTSIDEAPDAEGTSGWYATLDQTLWQGRARDGDASNHAAVGAFAQIGTANPNVQSVHAHRGGGMTISGLLAARPSDVIGVGITHASWGTGRETIGELFYQLPVSSHLSLVADIQRVSRLDGPGLRTYGNVATMRTVLTF